MQQMNIKDISQSTNQSQFDAHFVILDHAAVC